MDDARQILTRGLQLIIALALLLWTVTPLVSGPLSWTVFGDASWRQHEVEVAIVLVMTAPQILFQGTIGMLNGFGLIRPAGLVTVLSGIVGLGSAFFFMTRFAAGGIAMVLGFGKAIGGGVALWVVWRHAQMRWSELRQARLASVFLEAPISGYLSLEAAVFTLSVLAAQSILTRSYGLTEIGYLNAAALIEATGILLLVSAGRPYFLPALGRIRTPHEKVAFIERFFVLLILGAVLGGTIMIVEGELVLRLLFGAGFGLAKNYLALYGLALVPELAVNIYGLLILHQGRFKTYTIVTSVPFVIRLTMIAGVSFFKASLELVPITNLAASLLAAMLAWRVATTDTRRSITSEGTSTIAIAITALLLLAGLAMLVHAGHFRSAQVLGAISLGGTLLSGGLMLQRLRQPSAASDGKQA